MQPLLDRFAAETPGHFPPGFRVHVAALTEVVAGNLRGTLLLLFAAVGVLLAVGCANVSILFLARGTGRLHEFAVRAALGAGWKRLAGQMFAESMVLALAGGAVGVLFAIAGVRAVAAWLPPDTLPPEAVIQLNLPVLVFSTAVAVAAGIVFGIAPALHFANPQLFALVCASSIRATAGRRSVGGRNLLAASQVALTVLMLAAAGGAMRSFVAVYHTTLGYDPHNVMTAGISLPDGSYTTYETRAAFYSAIHRRIEALPGVQSAAVAMFPVPPAETIRQGLEIMGRAPEKGQTVDVQETTGEYFATLRIPLLKGRTWSEAENGRAAHVTVINEEMARRFWPSSDPIGQKIRLPEFQAFTSWIVAAKDSNGWLEVIGVAGNTPNRGLREPVAPAAYVPYTLVMGDSMWMVVHTASAPMGMVHAVREQIHAVDPGQPVSRTDTAEDLLRAQGWAREQFVASLFLLLSMLTLALAATGLYSVMAYATALRAREFGIRMALGARRSHVIGLVLASAARTVSAGVVAGLILSIASNRLIAHWVSARAYDPLMLGLIAALLYGAAALAAFVPARRAASGDPVQVLRGE
jgi:predicted permease